MSDSMPPVWLWQSVISPHMAGLAVALAEEGVEVTYIAENSMSPERERQGWSPPALPGARLELASSDDQIRELVGAAPTNSVHICQGVRANGRVGQAQKALARRRLRQWVVMETVADQGWKGRIKRYEYARLFRRWRRRIEGVLATGHVTPDWVIARGMAAERVFPFAYFLPDQPLVSDFEHDHSPCFRFLFVGQFIERKRLDLLVDALASLTSYDFELMVIGSGPLEQSLREYAEAALPGRVHWVGRLPSSEIPSRMATADCLVLPSRRDGWGAVVSEALIAGTPAVCSDTCGSAGIVRASGSGGVFREGNRNELESLLRRSLESGKVSADVRRRLTSWAAASVTASAGAAYLQSILSHTAGRAVRPQPPWSISGPDSSWLSEKVG